MENVDMINATSDGMLLLGIEPRTPKALAQVLDQ